MSLLPFHARTHPIWFMDDFNFFDDFMSVRRKRNRDEYTPYCKVSEEDEYYNIEVHTPGMKRDNIKVELRDGVLSVYAEASDENSSRRYKRSWTVDKSTTPSHIHATYSEGLLSLKVDKASPKEPSSYAITIN